MSSNADAIPPRLFFVVGPLRTGSSLMARCLDDHLDAFCLCESEINRALFGDYILEHHCQRMSAHGFTLTETIERLDRKKQDDIPSLLRWYAEVTPRLSEIYRKPVIATLGEKSPDFFRSPTLVDYLAANFPLIYTVRDPRAILRSIESQTDATPEAKAERWGFLIDNYKAWKPHFDSPNLLVVKYEDLLTSTGKTMHLVYEHLGLPQSLRYNEPFPRLFPERFLWTTAVDWETGIRKDFDASRISSWKKGLTEEQCGRIAAAEIVREFMERFGYET